MIAQCFHSVCLILFLTFTVTLLDSFEDWPQFEKMLHELTEQIQEKSLLNNEDEDS